MMSMLTYRPAFITRSRRVFPIGPPFPNVGELVARCPWCDFVNVYLGRRKVAHLRIAELKAAGVLP